MFMYRVVIAGDAFQLPGGAQHPENGGDIRGEAAGIITGPAVCQFCLGYAHLSGDITGVDKMSLFFQGKVTGECFTVHSRSLLFRDLHQTGADRITGIKK